MIGCSGSIKFANGVMLLYHKITENGKNAYMVSTSIDKRTTSTGIMSEAKLKAYIKTQRKIVAKE